MNWSVQYRSCLIDASANNSNLYVLKRTSTANSSVWSLAGQAAQPRTRAANSGIPFAGLASRTGYDFWPVARDRAYGREHTRLRSAWDCHIPSPLYQEYGITRQPSPKNYGIITLGTYHSIRVAVEVVLDNRRCSISLTYGT
jgi:hypothetical protein